MGYKVTARRTESHECRVMRQLHPDEVMHKQHVPATMFLETETAYLQFGGPKENYKPYLVLAGKPLKFQADFPGNISELSYDRVLDREPLYYTYELSRENLAEMAAKGMYESGFTVPKIFRKNVWELPCNCDIWYMPVTYGEGDKKKNSCLMFVRPEDGSMKDEENSLVCADDNMTVNGREIPGSGYDVASYFETVSTKTNDAEYADDFKAIKDSPSYAFSDSYEQVLKDASVEKETKYLGEKEVVTDKQDVAEEQQEDTAIYVDPSVYESMKHNAQMAWDEREAERLRKDESLEAVAKNDNADSHDDKDEEFCAITSDDTEETVDAPVFDTSDEELRRRRAVGMNLADNIDTVSEVLNEGDAVTPGNAVYIDHDVLDATKETVMGKGNGDTERVFDSGISEIPDDVANSLNFE